jgi:hypothetical protein
MRSIQGHADESGLPSPDSRGPYTHPMTEAGSPAKSEIAVVDIANAIANRWREGGETAELLTPTAVYLQERKLIEWVFEDAKSASASSELLDQIRKRGVNVAVVLPMPELGRAHEEFWGTGLTLYGWIDRGDNILRFTGPEVA